MKKIFVSLLGLTFLLGAFAVFAYSAGAPEDKNGQVSAEQQKFLQETKELRKERHDIRCQLMEASQAANPDQQKIDSLKKELAGIRGQMQAKAKELGVTIGSGSGQNKPLNCSGIAKAGTAQ